jgi:uncharacterized protein YegL
MKLDDLVEFAENPEPRCPCVLLLDTSSSMGGPPIQALNKGLATFKQNLMGNDLAARRVDVAVVTFDDSVRLVNPFTAVEQFTPPTLVAGGNTCMGAGIQMALELVAYRKKLYREGGITYYRPWIFMITDGAPTDDTDAAALRVKDEEAHHHVAFFAVGVEGADMDKLKDISVRAPVKLRGLRFSEMFVWLSASMQRVSQSKLGEQVALPPPGWGTV